MTSHINAVFEITEWDEQPFDDGLDLAKLTKASVGKRYTGDIEGGSATEWLMAYQVDGSAVFVGLERIKGTVAGRRGSLVIQHVGTFADGAANAVLSVVSGTGKLIGAEGRGTLVADPSGRITLDIDF
jgi:hypothetical protein